MAVIKQQSELGSGFQIDELAPSGTYVATCITVQDEFSVSRKKYGSEEMENVDVSRFLFGFKGKDGKIYKIQTFEMKQSASPKSALIKFLTSWLGSSPQVGWDYVEMEGKGAIIKVEHTTSSMGKTYAKIVSITPPKTDLADYTDRVLPLSAFGPGLVTQEPEAPSVPSAPPAFAPEEDDGIPF